MNSNDLNEIINECRQKGVFIHFDTWGMTVEKTGRGCSSKKCRILAEDFEDGNTVISLNFLVDAAVEQIEKEQTEGGAEDARGRHPGGTPQAEAGDTGSA